jgi:hypothetical protein
VCVHLGPAAELCNLAPGGFRLGQCFAGIGLVEKHLPLQVALLYKVAVDQGQRAHSGPRQQRRSRSPGRATAHYRYMTLG